MRQHFIFPFLVLFFGGLVFLVLSSKAQACAVCFGAKDSTMTQGLNMAIVTMLWILAAVLTTVIFSIVRFNRRAKLVNQSTLAR